MNARTVRPARREGIHQAATRPLVAETGESGFTLIELMVVVGIIAVLVSILLPAMGRMRDQSRAVKCATNLRAIGEGMQVYLNAYNRFFPPPKNGSVVLDPADPAKYVAFSNANMYFGVWLAKTAKLTPDVLTCPSNQQKDSAPGYANEQAAYGFNGWGNSHSHMTDSERTQYFGSLSEIALFRYVTSWDFGYAVGKQLGQVPNPSKTIFAQDAWETFLDGGSDGDTFASTNASQRGQIAEHPENDIEYLRHMRASNVVFVDGHVERMTREEQTDERYYTGNWAAARSY